MLSSYQLDHQLFFNHIQCITQGISALIPLISCVNIICKASSIRLSHFGLIELDE